MCYQALGHLRLNATPMDELKSSKLNFVQEKQTLYGLKQSPWYFFQYVTELLIKQGLTASKLDPCLFISKSLIVIIYVDGILIHGKSDDEINELMERLKQDDIALCHEGTAERVSRCRYPMRWK